MTTLIALFQSDNVDYIQLWGPAKVVMGKKYIGHKL